MADPPNKPGERRSGVVRGAQSVPAPAVSQQRRFPEVRYGLQGGSGELQAEFRMLAQKAAALMSRGWSQSLRTVDEWLDRLRAELGDPAVLEHLLTASHELLCLLAIDNAHLGEQHCQQLEKLAREFLEVRARYFEGPYGQEPFGATPHAPGAARQPPGDPESAVAPAAGSPLPTRLADAVAPRRTNHALFTAYRVKHKLTDERLAEKMDLERSVYYDLKRGRRVSAVSYRKAANVAKSSPGGAGGPFRPC